MARHAWNHPAPKTISSVRILIGSNSGGQFCCQCFIDGKERYQIASPESLAKTSLQLAAVEIAKVMDFYGTGPNRLIRNGRFCRGDATSEETETLCTSIPGDQLAIFALKLHEQIFSPAMMAAGQEAER